MIFMSTGLEKKKISFRDWFLTRTEFERIKNRLLDPPSEGFSAWARTTAGVIAFLFFLQFLSGVLLAFYYVPTSENAYSTVAYIEKVVQTGSWIRSVHYHASILLPIVLIAHLAQMILRNAYLRLSTAWTFTLIFLALVLAAAATGYVLPWDARAFNGVNVALSLAGNAPLFGETIREWLQNGTAISTLTVSRFYALHVFVTPMLILTCIAARVFFFGSKNSAGINNEKFREWSKIQFFRNAVAVGIVFSGLALFCAKNPAPLGPAAQESAGYLSRPGAQFLWLFELQKYTQGNLASILAFGFPALIIVGLLLLPVFGRRRGANYRLPIAALFIFGFGVVGVLTALSFIQDANDPRISKQIAKQQNDEIEFRASAFKPKLIRFDQKSEKADAATGDKQDSAVENNAVQIKKNVSQLNQETQKPPKVYQANCAKCHGANGEGTDLYPELKGVTTREDFPLTDQDLLEIINDAKAFGLDAEMPSFRKKLTEEEKLEIIAWLKTLR